MKVPERNKLISDCVSEYQKIHDDYFPRGSPLNDEQWEECIHKMDEVSAKYKEDIPNISGALCMAFLDDIEEYHKKWVEFKKNGKS